MSEVVRRFVTDIKSLYVVSNGVIYRQKMIDFMCRNRNWADELLSSRNNVGWCDEDTVLMITDSDRICRVSRRDFENMVNAGNVEDISGSHGKYRTVRYDKSIYTNERLQVDYSYKENNYVSVGTCYVTKFKLRYVPSGVNRLISLNKSVVFELRSGYLTLTPVSLFIDMYGHCWQDVLYGEDHRIGLADADNGVMICNDRIIPVNRKRADDLIKRADYNARVFDIGGCELIDVVYSTSIFPDDVISKSTFEQLTSQEKGDRHV